MRCTGKQLPPRLTNLVYREFDCYDPAARAPTPLPPLCLSDNDEEARAVEQRIDSGEQKAQRLEEGAGVFIFASNIDSKGGFITLRRDDLFRDHADRERLIGKMESALIESKYVSHYTLSRIARSVRVGRHFTFAAFNSILASNRCVPSRIS